MIKGNCDECRKQPRPGLWCLKCTYEPKDLVEVVRCKDCKYYDKGDGELDTAGHCWYRNGEPVMQNVKPTDYCSYGERVEHSELLEDVRNALKSIRERSPNDKDTISGEAVKIGEIK